MKPRGTGRGLSVSPARTEETSRGASGNGLLEKVLARENMLMALARVQKNGGAPGVDGVRAKSLRDYVKEHWMRIREELLAGTYQPKPVRRVEIPKPGGGVRLLGIPTVVDRLIQQALLQVLTPIFDPAFSPQSYGFRPGRRAHDAVRTARRYVEEGYKVVVDMDLEVLRPCKPRQAHGAGRAQGGRPPSVAADPEVSGIRNHGRRRGSQDGGRDATGWIM